MARVESRQQLLEQAGMEFAHLLAQVAATPEDVATTTAVCGAWTIKDVLAHLYGWQQLYFDWRRRGYDGQPVHLPAEGYKWNETPRLNEDLYQRYRDLPLAEVEILLKASHQSVADEIDGLTDEQVMRPGAFSWTGRNALETYLVSISAAHYKWARREIRRGLRHAQTVS
jgi:hypothetical protein